MEIVERLGPHAHLNRSPIEGIRDEPKEPPREEELGDVVPFVLRPVLVRGARAALPPDVVDDLLGSPDAEDRHEPAVDGPAGAPTAVAAERVDIPVRAVEPEEKEDDGRGEDGAVDRRDNELAAVVVVELLL